MKNLEHWDALKTPPPEMLKKITGGRLSGMTDIKPQWRYLALTEHFGPVGKGWKFDISELWITDGDKGVKVANAKILLYVRYGDDWSDPIPGVGGSMFVANESKGLYTSDEAYKMAITDALSTAAKLVGVGAEVYMGRAGGSKYGGQKQPPVKKPPAQKPAGKKPAPKRSPAEWTKDQNDKLKEMAASLQMSQQDVALWKGWVTKRVGADTWNDIPSIGKGGFVIAKFADLYDEWKTQPA